MKTFDLFVEASRGRNFVPKAFKIGKLLFKPVDKNLFTRTAMDHEYHSVDGMWKIIPTGYKVGVGAQATNLTKAGTTDKRLSWSIWSEEQGNLIYTYASLPKAKKGLGETLVAMEEGKNTGKITKEVTKEVSDLAYELVKLSKYTGVDIKSLMAEQHRLLKKNGHKV